jgi:uncharacterized hydrophobic protein (TIGR00271 family)
VIHLRIVAPEDRSGRVLELLKGNDSVCNVTHLPQAVKDPAGDLILADVAREDASVVLSDLRELRLDQDGSIAIEDVAAVLSDRAGRAVEHARGAPSDAVVWEEVAARTSESTELSGAFVVFMVVAALIAAVGIYLNSAILIVGAMVVGPEFGPIAGLCVAIATRRRDVAARSAVALALGFPAAIAAVLIASLVFKASSLTPEHFSNANHSLARIIATPDFFAFFVAACAGVAGVLSLSTAKSGALIGVLISVTTIPAAANVGVSTAYADWHSCRGSIAQLALNLVAILLAGTSTLTLQRVLYMRRRRDHLADPGRRRAGLPVGRSQRSPR